MLIFIKLKCIFLARNTTRCGSKQKRKCIFTKWFPFHDNEVKYLHVTIWAIAFLNCSEGSLHKIILIKEEEITSYNS